MTMLEILYFSEHHQFFQNSPGIKSLYDRGRKRFYLLAGGHAVGPGARWGGGGVISAKLSTGEATGKLGQGISLAESFESIVCNFIR